MGWFSNWFARPVSFAGAGPAEDEHPLVSVKEHDEALAKVPAFAGGLWSAATYKPAHPGRVGGSIAYKTLVVHTTDMMPEAFQALVTAWTNKAGNGACAHFLIGRDATQGTIQFVPITKNGNHAGGNPCGHYKLPTGALVHPNTVAIGVELHGAGYLRFRGGAWLHTDSGRNVAASDVYIDGRGRGFMAITPYQLRVLETLISDLGLPGLPEGSTISPDASYDSQGVADFASCKSPTVAGHVSLDPINRTDPGPQVMSWMRSKGFI